MNNDEVVARLVVLETFSMMALGIYLANSRNDPDFSKASALLEELRAAVSSQALSPSAKVIAERYATSLVETLRANLRDLRGEDGQLH